MRILVLGSGGQLGKCLQKCFEGSSHDTTFCLRSDLDITDYETLGNKINAIKPEVVINASAYTAVDKAEEEFNLAETINHKAVANLALICADYKSLLIHISTDYVFDGKAEVPYTENCPTNPKSIYGKSKCRGETAIINSGCKYFIFRTSWLFCEFGNNFVQTMLALGETRKEISVVSDEIGCPTYCHDLAQSLFNILNHSQIEKVPSGIYHYSQGPICSWYEFAKEIFIQAKMNGLKVPKKLIPIKSQDYLSLAKRPKFSVLSTKKFKEIFKLEIPVWKDGVRKVVELYALKEN